jgi:Fibronectin type III domain
MRRLKIKSSPPLLALTLLVGGFGAGLSPRVSAEVILDSELTSELVSAPSDVENLEAYPGDTTVTLTWDAATAEGGVDGYSVYMGLGSYVENGAYNLGDIDVGDKTTTIVDGLTNGMTYYFAVKAYDEEGRTSEDFSNEAEATPERSNVGDYTGPMVASAKAVTNTLVQVEFSEAVQLPDDASSAFSLEAFDGTFIEVLSAYVSQEDPRTVFLVTAEQSAGAQYVLTAGIQVEDTAGNPVSSGTSDTALFTGSALEKTEADPDEGTANASSIDSNEDFKVESVLNEESSEILLSFSQNLSTVEVGAFTLQLAQDASTVLEVLAVSVDVDVPSQVTLVTEDMEPGFDYILSMDESVLNEAGESLSLENRDVEFTAKTIDLKDVIAPEDITKFLAEITGEDSILLTWTPSVDSAGDLAKHLLYQSMDGGLNFESALTLSKTADAYEVEGLTPGESYTFKITAVDENGNESEGIMTTITLPETGPELLLLVPFALAAGFVSRRKKD